MTICFVISGMEWTGLSMEGILRNLTFEYFSKNCRENSKFHYNLEMITAALHEELLIQGLLKMNNISDKIVRELQTLIIFIFIPCKKLRCK